MCDSGRMDAQTVEGRAGRDVEAAEVVIAEAEIGGVLRQSYNPEAGRVRREDMDAAWPAAIDIACAVDLHAIGGAGTFSYRLRPYPPVRQIAVGQDIEPADVPADSVVDIELLLIQRKTQSVGLAEIVN